MWITPFLAASPLQADGPLAPDAERATFKLAPGFVAELVIAEPAAKKIVDVAFDDAGRMWAVTASEYPLDGNEDSRAAELYARGGRDQVLVVERPWEGETKTPRVFADGLAMPMSVLPLEHAAIVQHGSEILRLDDTDRDGRADQREVLLRGFGIEDSHLLPHRFLRAPDGWVYMAQGAFNRSNVVDRSGRTTRFDYCKLARFTLDGERFEVLGVGLNNIWGIAFDARGEFLIQEANDMGFGVIPFVFGATYPGIGQDRLRQYAPVQPTATELRFGGTGLSGLALTTSSGVLPEPFEGAVFVANPIERKVQAVRRVGSGVETRLEMLPELLTSADTRFRPVAIHFGPDDSLYVVDWYNPIISHNEVPRTHPDRDRERTRVWRLRASSAPRFEALDVTKLGARELVAGLEAPRMFVQRACWRQIVDRKLLEVAPELKKLALDGSKPVGARALALWSLEGLRSVDAQLASAMLRDADAALRQAVVRGFAASNAQLDNWLALDPQPLLDTNLEVRCEALRAIAALSGDEERIVELLLRGTPAPDESEAVICEQDRTRALRGASLAAMRERMWRRIGLESRADALAKWMGVDPAAAGASRAQNEPEARALAGLVLGDERGAVAVARTLRASGRKALPEELALCARHAAAPGVQEFLSVQLLNAARTEALLDAFLAAAPIQLTEQFRVDLVDAVSTIEDPRRLVQVVAALELTELSYRLDEIASSASAGGSDATRAMALRALVKFGAASDPLCTELYDRALPGNEVGSEALYALCVSRDSAGVRSALERIASAQPSIARVALQRVTNSKLGAAVLLDAALAGDVELQLLEPRVLDALRSALPERAADVEVLDTRLGNVGRDTLVLFGGPDDYFDADLSLAPPFTLEAWVNCAEQIENREGLLAAPGQWDFNFSGARPRLWLGPARGDVLISRRSLEAGRWTHVALSASADGRLRLFLDGELDSEVQVKDFPTATGLDVARTTPGFPELRITEWRLWSRERSPREIALELRRAVDGERPADLRLRLPGDVVKPSGNARIERSRDVPALLDDAQHRARSERYERFAALAAAGDASRGAPLFERTCLVCHALGGRGESVGPPLDGAGARGIDSLLAAVLEPSSAVEAGYRELRVELVDETSVVGRLLAESDDSLTIQPTSSAGASEPRVIDRAEIARVRWSKLSIMPEGLLESLTPADAGDLLAYLLSVR
jgi:putative membrane-bound dehydrogenase-like protein